MTTHGQERARTPRHRDAAGVLAAPWPLAALAAAVLVAFFPALRGEYVFDDRQVVERNAIVERGSPGEILTTSYWAGTAAVEDDTLYRPLTILSFALERRLAGAPSATISRAINLLLHLGVGLTLALLALRVGASRRAALWAAWLFALHPLHVEPVAAAVGRADLLAALFGLLGLALALGGAAPDGTRDPRPRDRWLAGACLLLALGAKESAIGLPAVLAGLLILVPPRRPSASRAAAIAADLVPAALAVAAYLLLRGVALEGLWVAPRPHPLDNHLVLLPPGQRAAAALALAAHAARILVWPVPLSVDYSGFTIAPPAGWTDPRVWIGAALLAALAAGVAVPLARAARGRRPGEAARVASGAAVILLGTYLVVGNLLVPIGTVFAERLLYLPSAGFCLLLGLGLAPLAGGARDAGRAARVRPAGAAAALLLVLLGAATWDRARDWRDERSVFEAAARDRPDSPRARFMVAEALRAAGRGDEALAAYRRTLELWPGHVQARVYQALLLGERGDYAGAERLLREALAINPDLAPAQFNLSLALQRQGRLQEAHRAARKAALRDPRFPGAWAQLGHLAAALGRPGEAARAYRRAIALGRRDLAPRLEELERAGAPTEP